MVNRKGFIKIAEVFIAITVILTILVIVYKSEVSEQNTVDLNEVARDVLKEISSIESLRSEVLGAQSNTASMVNTLSFINSSLPDYILFELRSCDLSSACGQSAYVGNVYSAERIISADTSTFDPIKLRLFLWVEE